MRTDALLRAGVIVLAFTAAAAAAPEPYWGQQADLLLENGKTTMHLTDAQVGKIKPILETHLKSMRVLFDSYAGQQVEVAPSLLQKFRDLREAFTANMRPILDSGQMEQLAQIRKEVNQAMKKAFCDARMKRLQKSLGLKDDQVVKARPIIDDEFDRRLAVIASHVDSAPGAEGKGTLTPELIKVRSDIDGRLKAVFTPEQMKTFLADRETIGD